METLFDLVDEINTREKCFNNIHVTIGEMLEQQDNFAASIRQSFLSLVPKNKHHDMFTLMQVLWRRLIPPHMARRAANGSREQVRDALH